jgi:curli biogenesis system outer membrane secretion channel CsgG
MNRPSNSTSSWCFLLLLAFALCGLFSCATAPVTEESEAGIAVWDIDDLSPGITHTNLGELFSAQIIEVLKNKGESVVERTRLLRVLEELRLGSSSLADESSRLGLGKLIGAKQMVFGGYQIVGDQMRIDLRLVEVETGRVRKAVKKTASSADLSGWIDAVRKAAGEL